MAQFITQGAEIYEFFSLDEARITIHHVLADRDRWKTANHDLVKMLRKDIEILQSQVNALNEENNYLKFHLQSAQVELQHTRDKLYHAQDMFMTAYGQSLSIPSQIQQSAERLVLSEQIEYIGNPFSNFIQDAPPTNLPNIGLQDEPHHVSDSAAFDQIFQALKDLEPMEPDSDLQSMSKLSIRDVIPTFQNQDTSQTPVAEIDPDDLSSELEYPESGGPTSPASTRFARDNRSITPIPTGLATEESRLQNLDHTIHPTFVDSPITTQSPLVVATSALDMSMVCELLPLEPDSFNLFFYTLLETKVGLLESDEELSGYVCLVCRSSCKTSGAVRTFSEETDPSVIVDHFQVRHPGEFNHVVLQMTTSS